MNMMRKIREKWLLSLLFVIAFVYCLSTNCFAKPMTITRTVDVYETPEDIDADNILGVFEEDSIVDVVSTDTVEKNGITYIHTYGLVHTKIENKQWNGYIDKSATKLIIKEIRTTEELSYYERNALFITAYRIMYDEAGLDLSSSLSELLENRYISMQLADQCAVVSWKGADDILFTTEFLFTLDEHNTGEYRALYVEQNGRSIFGNYVPLSETAATEDSLGVSFEGFTYEE